MSVRILHGNCLDILPTLAEASVDSVVTDPPYELGFMGKKWDKSGVAFRAETWEAIYRVMKPGAHLLAFGGTRTSHRMVCAIEDAGFEIRDSLSYLYDGGLAGPLLWCFGSGFPKSRNVSRDLDSVRCLCHVRQSAAVSSAVASGAVLQQNVRGDREADGSGDPNVRDLRQGLDTDDTLSGDQEQDLFASVQRGLDIKAGGGQAAQGGAFDTVSNVRNVIPSAEVAPGAQSERLLQRDMSEQVVCGQVKADCASGPDGMDGSLRGFLPQQDDRRDEPGMEGRNNLQTVEGELRGRSVGALPGGPADDEDGERLHHGASVGDGSMGRASTGSDGMRPSHRPRSKEQCAPQLRTLAEQSESQDGGAWPVCGGCGKPRIPDGIGTALKPACEPITLARKPLIGSVAANVLAHGTGGLNIEACRVGFASEADERESKDKNRHADFDSGPHRGKHGNYDPPGRWPANVAHDGSPEVMDAFAAYGDKSSPRANGNPNDPIHGSNGRGTSYKWGEGGRKSIDHRDTGTAARFFYSAKATNQDRMGSKHPTIKPLALMDWLVKLITPPGGTVLDPFAGSGTTLLAADRLQMNAIGIDMEASHVEDIRRRFTLDAPLFAEVAD